MSIAKISESAGGSCEALVAKLNESILLFIAGHGVQAADRIFYLAEFFIAKPNVSPSRTKETQADHMGRSIQVLFS